MEKVAPPIVTISLFAAMFSLATTKTTLGAIKVDLFAAKVGLAALKATGQFLGIYPVGIGNVRIESGHIP